MNVLDDLKPIFSLVLCVTVVLLVPAMMLFGLYTGALAFTAFTLGIWLLYYKKKEENQPQGEGQTFDDKLFVGDVAAYAEAEKKRDRALAQRR